MARESVLLKKNPKVEFQFLDNGFQLMDAQTPENAGFYAYDDLRAVELNSVWFPRLAKWLRVFTWIFNGVPFFPDAESCKKANLIIHCGKKKVGIWLTDTDMAEKAKKIQALLNQKINPRHS